MNVEDTGDAQQCECPVCKPREGSQDELMRALLSACRPSATPPTLRARIVSQVRIVAITSKFHLR